VTVVHVVTVCVGLGRLGLGVGMVLAGSGAVVMAGTSGPGAYPAGSWSAGRCDHAMIRAAVTNAHTAMKSTTATVPSLPLMACP
jgi:hypothetical protein